MFVRSLGMSRRDSWDGFPAARDRSSLWRPCLRFRALGESQRRLKIYVALRNRAACSGFRACRTAGLEMRLGRYSAIRQFWFWMKRPLPRELLDNAPTSTNGIQFAAVKIFGTRAFSIYVYTFHAIILPAGRGEAQVQAYSQDLRERVLRALERGDRPTEIARRFEVSRIGVYTICKRIVRAGDFQGGPEGARGTSLNSGRLSLVVRVLEETTRPGRSSKSQCHCRRNLDPRSKSEGRAATPPPQPANRPDLEGGLEREQSLGNPRIGFCLRVQR